MWPALVGYALAVLVAFAAAFFGFVFGRRIDRSAAEMQRAREVAIEALGAGMIVVDGRGAIASCNAEARLLLGLGTASSGDTSPRRNSTRHLPASESLLVLSALRENPELSALLVAGEGGAEYVIDEEGADRRIEARAFSAGPGRRGTILLLSDVTETAALLEELASLAYVDSLTGAINRRRFDEIGQRDLELARREGKEIGVLMLDIDFFKKVNDGYGHAAGDRTLKAVCDGCRDALRSTDVLARYGGEEFAVFLPGSGPEDSVMVAERLRRRVADQRLSYEGQQIAVTVSLGVYASVPEAVDDLALYLRRADEALYRSKALGRDRVSYWQPL
jgi:diguanylate cyclase (GGDEF) domain